MPPAGFPMNYRTVLTTISALLGIGLMVFYSWCDTSCSYLKGDIFGIDLKYLGIVYMLALIALGMGKLSATLRLLLASGIGVEIFLVSFQFRENVFCPFCLTFGALLLFMFFLNYEKPQPKNGWGRKLLYAAGEGKIPFFPLRIPLLIMIVLGYLFVVLAFTGSATPSY